MTSQFGWQWKPAPGLATNFYIDEWTQSQLWLLERETPEWFSYH